MHSSVKLHKTIELDLILDKGVFSPNTTSELFVDCLNKAEFNDEHTEQLTLASSMSDDSSR